MILLTLTLISTIQAVGCTLAIGLMAAPGAIAHLFNNSPRKNIFISSLLGIVISVSSIVISYYLDTPPGTLLIIIFGFVFILSVLVKKRLEHLNERAEE